MTYDWKEIFKNKTTRELYDIYSGKSALPEEPVQFAKEELDKRNFDFKNIGLFKESSKLEDITADIDYLSLGINRRTRFSIYAYLILILVFIPATYIVFKIKKIDINTLYIILPSCIIILTITILITNLIYKIRFKKLRDLIKIRLEIIKEFEDKGLIQEKLLLLENIEKQSDSRFKNVQKTNNILFIIATVMLILYAILSSIK